MDGPAVSLLFCTRNRAEQLKACLEHIARLIVSCSWELVIVDNGSIDDTGRILSEYAAMAPFPTVILYEGRAGKSRGLNQGLRVARGEIVALIDDDCYVAPDYIDRAREIFDDPRIGFAGGRVELFDPTDDPISTTATNELELLAPRNYVAPGWILGANMMFRRHVLETIGGFDPDLGPGTPFYGDDPDVQARASFAGWWGLFTPNAVVAHHHRRKEKDAAALMRVYYKGGGAYIAKFLLLSDTRSIYLRMWFSRWYWEFRRVARAGSVPPGRYALRYLLWEVQGVASYLEYRMRKRVANTS